MREQALAHLAKWVKTNDLCPPPALLRAFPQARQLAGAALERSGLSQVLRGMIADLLGEGQQRQHPTAAADASLLRCGELFVDHRLVEGGLLRA